MRTALVAGEVALALVLLVGAGLLVRSFVALRDAPLGFEATRLLAFDAGASEKSYPELAQQRRYIEELVSRVAALPGVDSAAAVTLRPLWGTVGMDWPFTIEGQSAKDAERNPLAQLRDGHAGLLPDDGHPAHAKGAPSTSTIATASRASRS